MENETQTMYELEYGKKYWKTLKMRNAHCRTCNMAGKLKKRRKWEKQTLGSGYGEKNEKHGKLEKYTLGHGIWRETLKRVENENAV